MSNFCFKSLFYPFQFDAHSFLLSISNRKCVFFRLCLILNHVSTVSPPNSSLSHLIRITNLRWNRLPCKKFEKSIFGEDPKLFFLYLFVLFCFLFLFIEKKKRIHRSYIIFFQSFQLPTHFELYEMQLFKNLFSLPN